MRTLFAIAFLGLLGTFQTQAQGVVEGTSSMKVGDLRFGAKMSLMLTDLVGDGVIDNSVAPGFQFGGAAEVPITDDIFFAPEMLFSFQGANGIDVNLFYLNFPLVGKYYITDKIAAEFGPQFGILLSDNIDNIFLDSNTLDLGITFGGGYYLMDMIYLQSRFNFGFTKVIENVKSYNATFQVGAIYYF
ncbi:outer membrane beta-barrel protein [Maribacter sp. 2-571]|uniref:outer membrane beta-barrel protein n=1 Tax=Maribacter sp. 2-571 TaxID=3417569 RepID=UPI003D347AA8